MEKKSTFFNTPWNQRGRFEKTAIVVGGLAASYLAYKQGKKIIDQHKIRRDIVNRKEEIIIYKTIPFTNPPYQYPSTINLTDIAYQIYDAFYNNDWFGITEDEEGAVKAIKQVPNEYISKLATVYAKNHKKNLYHDFKRFLSPDYYNSTVNTLLGDGLRSVMLSDGSIQVYRVYKNQRAAGY